MIHNYECTYCGSPLYKTPSEERQSKNKKFFCSHFCKNIYRGSKPMLPLPHTSPFFKAVIDVYNINMKPEYLVGLRVHNTIKYAKTLGEIHVVATARINGAPNLTKTAKDSEQIRRCFYGIKASDVLSLPDVESNWKCIELRYWNPQDITYEIED